MTVFLLGRLTSADHAAAKTNQRIVAASEMAGFLRTLSRRQTDEYPAVLRDAEQRFPKGTVLEGVPESVSEQLPIQAPPPLNLARGQLVRDGLDPADMKAVTIFKGDTGTIQVDIIVVLRRDNNAVAGVYGAFWGRCRVPIPTDYRAGTPGFTFVANAIDDARDNGLKWIVVSMHKNYIATFAKRNEVSTDGGATFMTMLLDKKVDLILQGHEHGYARSKQLTTNRSTCPVLPVDAFNEACVVDADNDLVKGAGTIIQIISTGGKGMRLVERADSEHEYFVDNFRDADSETFGFGEFTVTPTDLLFSFVRSAGQPFDESFRIREQHLTEDVSSRR